MEIGSRGKHHLLLQTSPLTPYLTDEDPAHESRHHLQDILGEAEVQVPLITEAS